MQQKRWIKTKREHSEKALIRKGKKKKKREKEWCGFAHAGSNA